MSHAKICGKRVAYRAIESCRQSLLPLTNQQMNGQIARVTAVLTAAQTLAKPYLRSGFGSDVERTGAGIGTVNTGSGILSAPRYDQFGRNAPPNSTSGDLFVDCSVSRH